MNIPEAIKKTLHTLSYDQVQALEKLKDILILQWTSVTVKKDTEFETIWAVASRESKQHGLVEFLQILNNPEK